MSFPKVLTAAAAAFLLAASVAQAEVQVTIAHGRVTIVAREVTVRQILAEWARVGQTRMVNTDRVSGGPVTLELRNVTEQQALDVLLRGVSGYLVAPRQMAVANASMFDRVIVMPTSVAPPSAPIARPQPPVFQQPGQSQFGQPGMQPGPDDQDEGVPPQPGQPARGPVFNTFPQPQVINPQQGGAAPAQGSLQLPLPQAGGATSAQAPYPGAPTTPTQGVSVPGMIVAPPAQPGQPGQPTAPGTPVRRPPGGPD